MLIKTSFTNLFRLRKSTENKGSSSTNIQGRPTQSKGTEPSVRTPSPLTNMISMVEFNSANKDRAIDVPESFVARTKTPPRYPPPKVQHRVAENARHYNNNYYNDANKSKDVPSVPTNGGFHTSVLLEEQLQNSTSEAEASRMKKYEDDLKIRRDQREEQAADLQRTSIRESEKLRSLATSVPLSGLNNEAFDNEESLSNLNSTVSTNVSGVDELVTSLQHIQTVLRSNSQRFGVNMAAVNNLFGNREFQNILTIQNKVQENFCIRRPPSPATTMARQVVDECMEYLKESPSPAAIEVASLLSSYNVDGVLYAHDSIAERYVSPTFEVNDVEKIEPQDMKPEPIMYSSPPPEQNENVKLVRIDKTDEPLGATIRHDDESSESYQPIIIGRIVRGGAAEKCGRLRVGDEILEVNGNDVRGKTIHEVCDMLAGITGTLSFIIAVRGLHEPESLEPKLIKQTMHVKAHFDYDPEEDHLNPCKEMALSIEKGDILHVVDQSDSKWWQAYRDGETDHSLAGLIPSKSFQQQREAERQNVVGETVSKMKSKKGKLLCAKKQHKKKHKQFLYPSYKDESKPQDLLTYEEVALYYPTQNIKRPVVLIGPPNIGRQELRQKLMEDTEKFAAAVPHTSRTRMDVEVDGQDYHFISRPQFEAMILSRRFVEHGEYERSYYGTSIDAIRHVVLQGKTCVLNLHPVALETLRTSDLKPYVVLVAPPALEKLRHRINATGQPFKDDELKEIIEKAREMEDLYGHYFDQVIVNQDLDRTYASLMHHINMLEREPQWVPAPWLSKEE